jgi:hypothetical protein
MYHRYLIKITLAAAVVAATVASSLAADDFGKGSINWTDGYIEAIGYGTAQPTGNKGKDRINARRAAEVTVQRTLLETIKGVRIDSATTVENSMLKEDVIKTRVDGIVKGAQTIEEKLEWEGNSPVFMVKMRICLNGGVAECKGSSLVNVLNLEKREDQPSIPKTMLSTMVLNDKDRASPVKPPAATAPQSGANRHFACDLTKPVTGIVLTLEGRYFERSLLPVVVTKMNDDMVTVYSAKIVKPSVIRTYGAVRYAETIDNAVKISHLGGNVLVVQVADISKDNQIIISAQDAATIKETLAHGNDYLGEAKVVITVR